MKDKETVRKHFPDAEAVALREGPAYAISLPRRQLILARGVSEDDAWKQAAVTLRWEGRLRKKRPARRLNAHR